MTKSNGAAGCFTNRSERFWKKLVKGLTSGVALAEQTGLISELVISEGLKVGLKSIDFLSHCAELLE